MSWSLLFSTLWALCMIWKEVGAKMQNSGCLQQWRQTLSLDLPMIYKLHNYHSGGPLIVPMPRTHPWDSGQFSKFQTIPKRFKAILLPALSPYALLTFLNLFYYITMYGVQNPCLSVKHSLESESLSSPASQLQFYHLMKANLRFCSFFICKIGLIKVFI